MSLHTVAPSVSVIMATRGRPENLVKITSSVLVDATVRHLVIVIDGEDKASVATLLELQKAYDRLVFAEIPHSGQLKALSVGVDLTDADVVLLLDDDVMPTPSLAAAHARQHMTEPGLVLVGAMPVQLPAGKADLGTLLYARDYLHHCERIAAGEHAVLDQLWLGNVSIRRAHAVAVGLYSPGFTASYHADRDLGFRLAEAGMIGRYDPTLAAAHLHRRTGAAFLHDARRRGAGLAHLHEKHRWLGPFDPAIFTEDLPVVVRAAVRRIGSTRLAPVVASALLGVANALRITNRGSSRMLLAKLARRIMLVWGTTTGEGAVPAPAATIPAVSQCGPLAGSGVRRDGYDRLAAR